MILTDAAKLRVLSEKVSIEDGLSIGAKLILELEKHKNGIGLAAPQIGINKRVFVIKLEEKSFPIVYINPEIIKKKKPFINKDEGCLSFPEILVDTIRYKEIFAIDDLTKKSYSLEGLASICFQHELQHLDGKLMFDFKVPDKYDLCFCESGKKYKFCHFKEISDGSKA